MIIWFLIIFLFSVVLAIYSMRDFGIPKELKEFLISRRIKGTILFFKDRTKHYHS